MVRKEQTTAWKKLITVGRFSLWETKDKGIVSDFVCQKLDRGHGDNREKRGIPFRRSGFNKKATFLIEFLPHG